LRYINVNILKTVTSDMSETGVLLPLKGNMILDQEDETVRAFAGLFSSRLTLKSAEKIVDVERKEHRAMHNDHDGEFESLYRDSQPRKGKAGFVGFGCEHYPLSNHLSDTEAKLNDHDDQFLQLLVDKDSLKEELRTIVCAMSCRDAVKATVEYIRTNKEQLDAPSNIWVPLKPINPICGCLRMFKMFKKPATGHNFETNEPDM